MKNKNYLWLLFVLLLPIVGGFFWPKQNTDAPVSITDTTTPASTVTPLVLVNTPSATPVYLPIATRDAVSTPTEEHPPAKVEPTLPVESRALYDGFALVHLPIEQLTFVKWQTIETVQVVNGTSVKTISKVLSVTDENCQGSLLDNIKKVYQAFKQIGADWHAIGAMVLTESGFKQFVRGSDGQCHVLQNYQGAPAYCMMQIYAPAHPNVSIDALSDINYCISVGRGVYSGMFSISSGDPVQAAACYKGFCQKGMRGKDEPGFIGNYMGAYNSSGFTAGGQFISWDENQLLTTFPDWK